MKQIERVEVEHARIGPWVVIGLWFFYGVLSINQSILWNQVMNRPFQWKTVIAFAVTLCTTWAVFTPIVIAAARRFPLGRIGWQRGLLVHVPLMLTLSILDVRIDRWVGPHFGFGRPQTFWAEWLWALDMNMFYYAVITTCVIAADLYYMYRERQRKAHELQTELVTSRLESLKMQLQPHFLFNTLNAINALIHEDREAADRMVTRLADLLRLTLYESRQQVPLARELEFVSAYVEIQQIRFQNRLTVSIEVKGPVLGALVPSLVLQPIVENAIRHGIGPRVRDGHVWVRARREHDILVLEVEDDGVGFRPGDDVRSSGIGLRNTRARLQQLYEDDHQMVIRPLERGTLVRIILPYQEAPETNGVGEVSGDREPVVAFGVSDTSALAP
jgi:two-component system LytT family sensor kinase